jgi:molecular chaperone DnaK (HSP70)
VGRQVSAEEKKSGRSTKITITSEKGRLSESEIERMVKEAEQFAEQDQKDKARDGTEGSAGTSP